MASTEVKRRRGTTLQISTFTGALGEIIYSTDDKRLYVHDATTAGGAIIPNGADAQIQLVQAADIAQAVAATYTVTLAPAPAAYTKYMRVVGVVASASDGDDTINVNGLGARTIKKNGGADNLVSGDLAANGLYAFVFDGTNFQLEGPTAIGGKLVQVLNVQDGTVATGTTTMPEDNTIPQNTEGVQFMSLVITPQSASNILHIDVVCNISTPGTDIASAALFQDATANALAAAQSLPGASQRSANIVFRHKMTAGTTSATTFKVRASGPAAGTYTFNGAVTSGVQVYGGVVASSITISEYQV